MCELQQACAPIVHVGVRVEDRKPAVVHTLNICSFVFAQPLPDVHRLLTSISEQLSPTLYHNWCHTKVSLFLS